MSNVLRIAPRTGDTGDKKMVPTIKGNEWRLTRTLGIKT
jgi:hypothetical protein